MMRVQVTFIADDDMITDAIATLYAIGKKPTKSSVRTVIREWYEHYGAQADAESVDERNFVDDIVIEPEHWQAAILSPLRAELCEKW